MRSVEKITATAFALTPASNAYHPFLSTHATPFFESGNELPEAVKVIECARWSPTDAIAPSRQVV